MVNVVVKDRCYSDPPSNTYPTRCYSLIRHRHRIS